MREICQRTQAFGFCFQLSESYTKEVNDLIKGGTSESGKLLFPKMVPEMFDGMKFWTVGGLCNQADVFRDDEVFGLVPSRVINLHHEKKVREGLAHMREKQVHHRCICMGQDQGSHFPFCWSNGCVHIGVVAHDLSWGLRSDTLGCPGSSGFTDAANAAFVLSQLEH